MDRTLVVTEAFFSSPITWGVVTLLAIALALSGKLSVTAATGVLWLAFFTALFGVYRGEAMLKMDILMRCLIFGCFAFGFAAGAVALNRWMNSPKVPETSTSQPQKGADTKRDASDTESAKTSSPVQRNPPPPPAIVQQSAPYGNLANRCKELG